MIPTCITLRRERIPRGAKRSEAKRNGEVFVSERRPRRPSSKEFGGLDNWVDMVPGSLAYVSDNCLCRP
jgi:hypothetical protein